MNRISLIDLAKNSQWSRYWKKKSKCARMSYTNNAGEGQGFALQDWLEAEAEVLARFSESPAQ